MPPIKRKPTAQTEQEQSPVNVPSPKPFVRPLQDFLNDGRYPAEIIAAQEIEVNGKSMLRLVVKVTDESDIEQDETFLLKPDYRQSSSPFFKLLEVTGCMPKRGQGLDLSVLVGQQLMLTLKTVNKNGKDYTNIDDVEAMPDEEADANADVDVGDDAEVGGYATEM